MAFLDSEDYCVFGPELSVEEMPYVYGFTLTYTTRTIRTLRVVWGIDAEGGESPPATWTVGEDEYRLLSTMVERGFGDPLGHYTAVYRLEGEWTPVTP